ncbi:hypothetical protein F7725_004912 [Dissostichus mawsoni]|uniref:Ion transport domain-containing protein n=1 Tax=Dissostichus mawsoni TaxID=36200 RepID=A0A7J5XMS3_DISMA|nr:hypothetical protein F7725_004912 [Dissostichus mawsoni]
MPAAPGDALVRRVPRLEEETLAVKLVTCFIIGLLFPFFSLFICHTASYLTFLFLLLLASQHIARTNLHMQGPPPTLVEWMILPWVVGFIWAEIKEMWDGGFTEYIHDWWNLMDFAMNSLYLATISLKIVAYVKEWEMWHPTLIAEALFAIANIFSSLRLISLFTANSHLGPLQISLGRMLLDILKFLFIYCLTKASEEPNNCKGIRCERQNNAFSTLFETLQSLFWSIFGLLNLYVTNVKARHEFTEFVGATMFGTYNVISLVVLLNMLIAMMNNSYQLIADHADIEWKFARTKLWMSYFDEGGTLPPPFNIIPSPKSILFLLLWLHNKLCRGAAPQASTRTSEVIRSLVKRYVAAMIRSAKTDEGLTEENFKELKQDISSFRYEVLDLLGNRRPPRRQYSSSSETTRDDGAAASEDDSESGDGCSSQSPAHAVAVLLVVLHHLRRVPAPLRSHDFDLDDVSRSESRLHEVGRRRRSGDLIIGDPAFSPRRTNGGRDSLLLPLPPPCPCQSLHCASNMSESSSRLLDSSEDVFQGEGGAGGGVEEGGGGGGGGVG